MYLSTVLAFSLPVQVFAILTLQLLFTFSVVCVFTFSSVVKKAVQKDIWAYVSSYIIFIVVASVLSFCKSFSRRHPWNIVGLVGQKCIIVSKRKPLFPLKLCSQAHSFVMSRWGFVSVSN